jgi:hypothetical protein
LHRLQIVGRHVHAPLRAQRHRPLGVAHGGVNLAGCEKVLFQEGLQKDAAHLACAQNCHAHIGQLRGYFGGLNSDLRHLFPFPDS